MQTGYRTSDYFTMKPKEIGGIIFVVSVNRNDLA